MKARRLLVINPNSNTSVTDGIERALQSFHRPGEFEITCCTLDDAPFGIESDADIAAVVPLLVNVISSHADSYDGFVIACYSDPALAECRRIGAKPVFGIHESAVSLPASRGQRFGVLALGRESIQRHLAYVRQLGFDTFHAGERPLDINVDEAANDPGTLAKIIDTGRELVEENGAETIILGCAGMALHRKAAEDALGVPVIDPVQAAVMMAEQTLR